MYLRRTFTVTDRETQLDVIRDAGWGCLFGMDDGAPIASHLPFLVVGEPGREKLEGHMSRANPHWRTFSGAGDMLVVFQGPHSYVTPSLSEAEGALPTWNYAAVHVYGRPVIVDAPEEVRGLIKRLVDHRESRFDTPWRLESLDEGWVDSKLRGIVGFEIPIDRMETTFRLMQNRTPEDRRRVADALAGYDDTSSQDVAAMMRRFSLEPAQT
jgi:transcriptional regulator